MTDERRLEHRHNTRGSGQRRPGPQQRRQEKLEKDAPTTPAATATAPAPRSTRPDYATRPPDNVRPTPGFRKPPKPGTRGAERGRTPAVHTVKPTASDDGEATVVLHPRGLERLQAGHPWIYRSDLDAHPALEGGAAVRVVDGRGWFVGKALYGRTSQIALRMLTREEEPIDDDFFARRLSRALELREVFRPDPERQRAARLVHGEADLLPGLVVDRYADCLTLQTLTEGTEARKGFFAELLQERLRPRAIVERNDPKVRAHEGLPLVKGLLRGTLDGPVAYLEGEVTLLADLLEGQKTGAFLDQSENRIEAGRWAFGRALDCFTYNGGFALQLARKATHVTAVDISDKAAADARAAADRNPALADKIEVKSANVFDLLADEAEAGARYDTIVLDPPSFAKSKETREAALRGYKEINLRAFQLLNPGGVLVTASCSYHVDDALFEKTVLSAAVDAKRSAQVLERRGAGRDHPTLLGMPESRYIKCLILRVG